MDLHFTTENEAEVARVAAIERTFHQALEKGIAQIDRGEFIEEEDMDARVERMLRA